MHEIESLMGGFAVALSWFNLMLMFAGIILGVIIGVLPGLGGANGVAILLPVTFLVPPTSASAAFPPQTAPGKLNAATRPQTPRGCAVASMRRPGAHDQRRNSNAPKISPGIS